MGGFLVISSFLVVLIVSVASLPTEEDVICRNQLRKSFKSEWAIEAQQEMEERFQDEFVELFMSTVNTIEDPSYSGYEENIARFLSGHYLN